MFDTGDMEDYSCGDVVMAYKRKKKPHLWVCYDEETELPIAVCDTAKELAYAIGVSPATIRTMVERYEKGTTKSSRYRRVYL